MEQNWLCVDEGDGGPVIRDFAEALSACDAFSAEEEEKAEYARLHDMLSRLQSASTRPPQKVTKPIVEYGLVETLNDVSKCLGVLREATKAGYSVDGVVCAAFARKYGFALLDAEEEEDPEAIEAAEEFIKACEERDAIQWNQPGATIQQWGIPMDVKLKKPIEDKVWYPE